FFPLERALIRSVSDVDSSRMVGSATRHSYRSGTRRFDAVRLGVSALVHSWNLVRNLRLWPSRRIPKNSSACVGGARANKIASTAPTADAHSTAVPSTQNLAVNARSARWRVQVTRTNMISASRGKTLVICSKPSAPLVVREDERMELKCMNREW